MTELAFLFAPHTTYVHIEERTSSPAPLSPRRELTLQELHQLGLADVAVCYDYTNDVFEFSPFQSTNTFPFHSIAYYEEIGRAGFNNPGLVVLFEPVDVVEPDDYHHCFVVPGWRIPIGIPIIPGLPITIRAVDFHINIRYAERSLLMRVIRHMEFEQARRWLGHLYRYVSLFIPCYRRATGTLLSKVGGGCHTGSMSDMASQSQVAQALP